MTMVECFAIGGPRDGDVIDLVPDKYYFRHLVSTGEAYTTCDYERFTWKTASGRVFYVLAEHNPSGYAGELTIELVAKELDAITPEWPTRPLRVTVGMMKLHREFLRAIMPLYDEAIGLQNEVKR